MEFSKKKTTYNKQLSINLKIFVKNLTYCLYYTVADNLSDLFSLDKDVKMLDVSRLFFIRTFL